LFYTRGYWTCRLDIKKLIEAPQEALPSDLWQWIQAHSDVAVSDFEEAAKCLAFGLSTAVGFHLMRFTEALLFPYYDKLPPIEGSPPSLRSKPSDRNWGNYIDRLKKRKAKESIIGLLFHLKNDYRNPLMHPDDTLTSTEANLLLGTVQGIAYALYDDLKTRNLV
jgi:hypothetical protein